jgi:hypothetical protein
MVKADELDVEMDPETLAKAGGVDGDLLTDVPGDYLNWVDPADGFQHYFNSNELKKRAAAVASAATMMADMRNRGELRPEGTTDGVSGKPVKRKPGDERDESHGAFIFECFTLLDVDDDELLTIDEMKRWVQVICPGVEVTDEFLKDLLITVGKEDTPEYEGGPSVRAAAARPSPDHGASSRPRVGCAAGAAAEERVRRRRGQRTLSRGSSSSCSRSTFMSCSARSTWARSTLGSSASPAGTRPAPAPSSRCRRPRRRLSR